MNLNIFISYDKSHIQSYGREWLINIHLLSLGTKLNLHHRDPRNGLIISISIRSNHRPRMCCSLANIPIDYNTSHTQSILNRDYHSISRDRTSTNMPNMKPQPILWSPAKSLSFSRMYSESPYLLPKWCAPKMKRNTPVVIKCGNEQFPIISRCFSHFQTWPLVQGFPSSPLCAYGNDDTLVISESYPIIFTLYPHHYTLW